MKITLEIVLDEDREKTMANGQRPRCVEYDKFAL